MIRITFGQHNRSKLVNRYFVKIIWDAKKTGYPESKTYIHGKRVRFNRGDTGYMLDCNIDHKWGFNILVYHGGVAFDGIRMEVYTPWYARIGR